MAIRLLFDSVPEQPHNPNKIREIPLRFQVENYPTTYDGRQRAWLLNDPGNPRRLDKNLLNSNSTPKSRAGAGCGLLELYERIEYTILDYQMEYSYYDNNNHRKIYMPYLFITPSKGWKLKDTHTNKTYIVADIILEKNIENKSSFGGTILLDSEGPPINHRLRWVDQFGESDDIKKVITAAPMDDIEMIIRQRPAEGDVKDNKGAGFTPCIAYSLRTYEPASIGPHPFGSRRQVKPRIMDIYTDIDDPNMNVVVRGHNMDVLVEFKAYAIGGKIADRLSVWLKNYFSVYNSVLMYLGVQQMNFWGTSKDTNIATVNFDLSKRVVVMYFRLQELSSKLVPKLRKIDSTIDLYPGNEVMPNTTSEPEPDQYAEDTSGNYLHGDISIIE